MIKVVGCWEQGWNTPIMEYDLWNFPLRDFGVDEFIMTPVSGINKKITEEKDIQTVIDANPELVPVYVDEGGEIPLKEFKHPENVLYILGKAGYSPYRNKEQGISIKIETPQNKALLWGHQAIAIVLYDRIQKWQ